MPDGIDCLRCHTPMEAGYVLDSTRNGWTEQKWNPGEVEKHWYGTMQPAGALPVRTMRCPKCGALESYARRG